MWLRPFILSKFCTYNRGLNWNLIYKWIRNSQRRRFEDYMSISASLRLNPTSGAYEQEEMGQVGWASHRQFLPPLQRGETSPCKDAILRTEIIMKGAGALGNWGLTTHGPGLLAFLTREEATSQAISERWQLRAHNPGSVTTPVWCDLKPPGSV